MRSGARETSGGITRLFPGTRVATWVCMKKKTRRALKKAVKTVSKGVATMSMPGSAAVGALSIGGLVVAVARDPEVRERARALAHATLDRALDLLAGDSQRAANDADLDEADGEDSGDGASHKHAH